MSRSWPPPGRCGSRPAPSATAWHASLRAARRPDAGRRHPCPTVHGAARCGGCWARCPQRGRPGRIGSRMSELRPSSPVRRPDTARPRTADAHEHDTVADAAAGGRAAAQRRTGDPRGAGPHPACTWRACPSTPVPTVDQDDALGVLMVRRRGAGAALNYAALPRWDATTWRSSLDRVTRCHASGRQLAVDAADRPARPATGPRPGHGLARLAPAAGRDGAVGRACVGRAPPRPAAPVRGGPATLGG